MADYKISDLTTGVPAAADLLEFTAVGSPNVSKRTTVTTLLAALPYIPGEKSDSAAIAGELYYSTDVGKLAYKDSGDVVHALY